MFTELKEAYAKWARRLARRYAREGRAVEPGEKAGTAHATNRLVAWFMTLPESDRERIAEEGERVLELLRTRDPDYEGPLDIPVRPDTALRPAATVAAWSVAGGWASGREVGAAGPEAEGAHPRLPEPQRKARRRRNGENQPAQ